MNIEKPLITIFLEINGVFYYPPGKEKVKEVANLIFGRYRPASRPLKQFDIVEARLLYEPSVSSFHHFLEEVEKIAQPEIILYGSWAELGSTTYIKNVLEIHTFAKYITNTIDRPLHEWLNNYPMDCPYLIVSKDDTPHPNWVKRHIVRAKPLFSRIEAEKACQLTIKMISNNIELDERDRKDSES